ncbi:hypothetical protein Gogos_012723, partial [Gossypium gossypioides]|nr:hypothetical protein [Gossypium gossypioides]
MNVQISSIKQSFRKGCLRCSGGDETAFHAIQECTKACVILVLRGPNGSLLKSVHERCIDWLKDAMHLLDKNVFEALITILWNLWNSRNNAIFQGKNEDAKAIWKWVKILGDDFRIHNLTNKEIFPMSPRPQKWEKPPIG